MARIAHLSDIHFGCQDDKVVDGANAWLQEQQPDL
ncbi:MAG TPA: metallophosphoesterase, partial [Allosphingosinicella sp.]|nr:metallophosphoesterase [Allosphingosinicella sp.]